MCVYVWLASSPRPSHSREGLVLTACTCANIIQNLKSPVTFPGYCREDTCLVRRLGRHRRHLRRHKDPRGMFLSSCTAEGAWLALCMNSIQSRWGGYVSFFHSKRPAFQDDCQWEEQTQCAFLSLALVLKGLSSRVNLERN